MECPHFDAQLLGRDGQEELLECKDCGELYIQGGGSVKTIKKEMGRFNMERFLRNS